MKTVKNSSNIEAYGYKDGVLTIRFKGGNEYTYADFPAEIHAKLDKAHEDGESVGRFFHAHIKSNYPATKREKD